MRTFTNLINENLNEKTKPLFERISTQLRELYESQSRFLEEKLNEMGFECHEHRIRVKDGYKTEAGITIYFKSNDIEYALVDELSRIEFSLFTTKIENTLKKEDKLIQRGNNLEYVVKSLLENIKNKKTLEVYYMDESDNEREETLDVSSIFDQNRNLDIKPLSKELYKLIKLNFKDVDESFMTTLFVLKGQEFSLIGSREGFTINDSDGNDV